MNSMPGTPAESTKRGSRIESEPPPRYGRGVKLARIGDPGQERPAVVLDDGQRFLDVSNHVRDFDPEFFASGGLDRLAALDHGSLPSVGADSVRVGPPIASPGKIPCIGLNYADHAKESGQPTPKEPPVFMKAPGTIVGPADDILIPLKSAKTDYEVELGVVIGTRCRYLSSEAEALSYVAGYTIANDVSEREFQLERGGQWDKGKNCETFNPLGPWLVTADEVPDPQALDLSTTVNGQLRQKSTTAEMIFGVAHLIWYLSQFMVLEPGDVINTGTPAGVAMGMSPPGFLQEGDIVELTIAGLGRQRSRCRPAHT
jgi:2-keto-4-pentenoate hydratase/2-oxohepta-3-ene-1,7-dioic acid hydratase in catechol pathway